MRRVRRVGLALVDERRRLVGGLGTDVRRPGEDHEVGRRPVDEQRVARVERDEDDARIPLVPPLLTRSRPWSKNCPNSVNHELYGADRPTSGATLGMKNAPDRRDLGVRTGCRDGRRVVRRLVDDQVADPSRPGIVDHRSSGGSRRVVRRRLELRRDMAREELVGRAELVLVHAVVIDQVVAGAVDGAQTQRQRHADLVVRDLGDGIGTEQAVAEVRRPVADRVVLGDPDLLQDVNEVGLVEVEALSDRCLRADAGYRARRSRDQRREQAERDREQARKSSVAWGACDRSSIFFPA